jgi:nucleoid DNA-binding protein
LTKAQIIDELTRQSGLKKKEVTYIIENFLDKILEAVAQGERIEMRGFGTFYPVEKKSRTVYSPIAKKEIEVPPKRGVGFKPSKATETEIE